MKWRKSIHYQRHYLATARFLRGLNGCVWISTLLCFVWPAPWRSQSWQRRNKEHTTRSYYSCSWFIRMYSLLIIWYTTFLHVHYGLHPMHGVFLHWVLPVCRLPVENIRRVDYEIFVSRSRAISELCVDQSYVIERHKDWIGSTFWLVVWQCQLSRRAGSGLENGSLNELRDTMLL